MKWELEALKMLAKNPTVPGVALQDAISEIEKLQTEITKLRWQLQHEQRLVVQMGNVAESVSKEIKKRNVSKPIIKKGDE